MASGGRCGSIRGDGGDDDEFDLSGGEAGLFEGALGRLGGHVRGELVICGDAAFADAGASYNPLVAGIDLGGEFFVGENAFWHITAGACDADVDDGCRFTHAAGE